jgi:vanillate O-demethylase ferredoxin subunit
MDDWVDLRVKSKSRLTADVVMLELISITNQALPRFEAGAYIDIQIPGGILRPYSICNAPHETHRYVIAVRRESPSRGASQYLHDQLKEGDLLSVRHPRNEFALNPAATYSALYGGGVGIAPLICMAEELWRRGSAFDLHLSARNYQDAPFAEHLMQVPYKDRVHFHWSENPNGRVEFESCFNKLSPLSHVYLCGPSGYMNSAVGVAIKTGFSQKRLHLESFT